MGGSLQTVLHGIFLLGTHSLGVLALPWPRPLWLPGPQVASRAAGPSHRQDPARLDSQGLRPRHPSSQHRIPPHHPLPALPIPARQTAGNRRLRWGNPAP